MALVALEELRQKALQIRNKSGLSFIASRNRSAVVEGSTETSFRSGGGGATAVFQSEMTSATDGDPSNATRSAPPQAAAKPDDVLLSSLHLDGRGNRGLA
jgi:hypothetical protein